jgi:hypothetical protein
MAEIEFITLCDAAQSINGKLYILGGAWSQINRSVVQNAQNEPAPPNQFAIAGSIAVDGHEANQPIPFRVTVEDVDANELFAVEGQFVTGRPPLPGPTPLRATLAVAVTIVFPRAGDYCARARIPSQDRERVASFTVLDVPAFKP